MSWVDKKGHVLILSTHEEHVAKESEHVYVERKVENIVVLVDTSPIHVQYQT